jgi:hypothetical protein
MKKERQRFTELNAFRFTKAEKYYCRLARKGAPVFVQKTGADAGLKLGDVLRAFRRIKERRRI